MYDKKYIHHCTDLYLHIISTEIHRYFKGEIEEICEVILISWINKVAHLIPEQCTCHSNPSRVYVWLLYKLPSALVSAAESWSKLTELGRSTQSPWATPSPPCLGPDHSRSSSVCWPDSPGQYEEDPPWPGLSTPAFFSQRLKVQFLPSMNKRLKEGEGRKLILLYVISRYYLIFFQTLTVHNT